MTRGLVLGMMVLALACGRGVTADSADGGRVFATACARCHGADGAGGVVPGTPAAPAPRNFRDSIFQTARTDDDIRDVIKRGKGVGMPPFGAALTPAEIDALVAHIRSLDPRRK